MVISLGRIDCHLPCIGNWYVYNHKNPQMDSLSPHSFLHILLLLTPLATFVNIHLVHILHLSNISQHNGQKANIMLTFPKSQRKSAYIIYQLYTNEFVNDNVHSIFLFIFHNILRPCLKGNAVKRTHIKSNCHTQCAWASIC